MSRPVKNNVLKLISTLVLVVTVLGACSIDESGSATATSEPTAAAVSASAPEPSPAPTPAPTVEAVVTPTAPSPAAVDPVETSDDAALQVDPTTVLGMSADARHGYVAARNAWLDPVPCGSAPEPALVGVDIEPSTPDNVVLFDGGFEAVGSLQQMAFSDEGRAAVLLSCGESTETPWLQILDFDDEGRVTEVGPVLDLPEQDSLSGPYLASWDGNSQVSIYVYPNSEWHELAIDAATGEVLASQQRSYLDDFVLPARKWKTSPDGQFSYREIDDPQGRPGCEGTGFVTTIEVDGGSGPRPALHDPDQVFASVSDLHFGPDQLVSWRSWCEGFALPYVGRIDADGMIINVNYIEVSAIDGQVDDTSTEFRDYRLTNDGFLVGVGARYGATDDPQVALFKHDLAADPRFAAQPDAG